MTSELMSLTWVVALSTIMWVPYVLNTIMVRGLVDAVGYPDNPKPVAPWAAVAAASLAHQNTRPSSRAASASARTRPA